MFMPTYMLIFFNLSYIATTTAMLDISAKLLECTELQSCLSKAQPLPDVTIRNDKRNILYQKLRFQDPSVIKDCLRKLQILVNLKYNGLISGDDELIVVDDVMDPITGNATRLLNPVVIKLRREQPQIVYPLEFDKVVNSGVFEETLSSHEPKVCDEVACATNIIQEALPGSEGLCCTCDGVNRISRSIPHVKPIISPEEPTILSQSPIVPSKIIHIHLLPDPLSGNLPQFFFELDKSLMNHSKNDHFRRVREVDHIKTDRKEPEALLLPAMENTENPIESDNMSELLNAKVRRFREIKGIENGESHRSRIDRERLQQVVEKRRTLKRDGRHSCKERNGVNTSAHCLRFSDLWYNVYAFAEPYIIEEVSVKIFQKKDGSDDSCYWSDLTRGNFTRLGTHYSAVKDELPTISLSYSSKLNSVGCQGGQCPIDYQSYVLLVPSQKSSNLDAHPETKGGPGEYLVVPKRQMATVSNDCNLDGTWFDAFNNQTDRCQGTQGGCLKNQPVDLWIHDMENQLSGKKGNYFLGNYGSLAGTPLQSNQIVATGGSLALEYTAPFESSIQVELRADSNALIRKGWNMRIQSITCDSSSQQRTVVEIVLVNVGLISGGIQPWVVDCAGNFPAISSGPTVIVQPLQRHVFEMIIEGSLPTTSMICTVEIHNGLQERVASRQVMIRKQVRCLCAFHCSCSCVVAGSRMPCLPLLQEEYVAAGYRGSLPRNSEIPAQLPLQITYFNVVLSTLFVILLFGKIKVAIGCCFHTVGRFGLNFVRDGIESCLSPFLEKNHLDELLNRAGAEIVMNMFFFILYPTFILSALCCMCPSAVCKRSLPSANTAPDNNKHSIELSDELSGIESTQRKYSGEDEDERYVLGYLQARRSLT